MPYSVSIPVPQERIEEELTKARKELQRIDHERETVLNAIKAIQDCCSHSETYSGNTWGRWPYTRCKSCNKEW